MGDSALFLGALKYNASSIGSNGEMVATPGNASSTHFAARAAGHSNSTEVDVEFILAGVLMPIIGLFGMLGNLLNLTILSWRVNKRETDVLERGALLGLIALAVSDCCFCMILLSNIVVYDSKPQHYQKNFHFYYTLYGNYFHNVFIKISTWLTVNIAAARYVAICHPLRARMFVGLFATKLSIVLTYVVSFAIHVPLLWKYVVMEYPDPLWGADPANAGGSNITYIVDLGEFSHNQSLYLTFMYLWAFIGYFIPVAVLTFCNVNLIRALRESAKWRECSTRCNPPGRDANFRITLTLVALIVMFLVLVSPSELLQFYSDVVESSTYRTFELAILFTNVLQAINFACHFVLYCAVNVTFRRTLVNIFYMIVEKIRGKTVRRYTLATSRQHSMTMTRGGHARGSFSKTLESNL